MAVTGRDVAELVGVSPATVSLVVNGKAAGRVTPETEERVWAAVRELDYRVHSGASRLASGRPGNVVFVSPDPTNPFFSLLLDGLLEGLDDRFTLSVMAPRGDDYSTLTVRRAQAGDVAALVLVAPGDDIIRDLSTTRPTVLIDAGARVRGVSGMNVDVREAGRLLGDHLASLGHRRAAYLGLDRRRQTFRRRREALAAELAFVVPDTVVGRMSMDAARAAAAEALPGWMAAGVTAVVCADDLLAFGVLRAAADAGVAVPAQLSVAGFNDTAYAAMVTPSLTSVDLRARDLGRGTAALLIDLLSGAAPSWAQVAPRLVVRSSTGPTR
ncbi:MAG: LacI family DNA-binding transcriptional regulator [Pseudolysinimonas sp.]